MIAIRSTWNVEHHESGRLSYATVTRVVATASIAKAVVQRIAPPPPPPRPRPTPIARVPYVPRAPRIARGVHRARVLELLREHGAGSGPRVLVSDLAAAMGITPGAVSWHLNMLAKRGLVRRERYGDWRAEVSDTVSETRTDHPTTH